MKMRRLEISDPDSARLTISGLLKIKQIASRLIEKSEAVNLREFERAEFKMQFGKVILTCDEFMLNIAKTNEDLDIESAAVLAEIDIWTELLGHERAESPMILISSQSEDSIICSDEEFAKSVLEDLDRMLEEIHEIVGIVDESNCSEKEKQGLRAMLGYLVSFYNAIHISVFIDHPSLVPDDDWREMVEAAKKNRPILG